MADIVSTSETKVFQIKKWLGLNESPDGDTHMKLGEAAEMRNFRVTAEGHLQLRPGYQALLTLTEGSPVRGMWGGYVDGKLRVAAACGGRLWDVDLESAGAADLGEIGEGEVSFFGFAKKLYILTGGEYYVWDGAGSVGIVQGYAPIVATACPPGGGGTQLEGNNALTGRKRARFSPDGASTTFQLPESEIDEVLSVEGTSAAYTVDVKAGTVTFASAPTTGTNTIEIEWRKGEGNRETVTAMRFAELYNGDTDSRVFLYGDGTNRAVYSGLDEFGQPSAEYFPVLNELRADSANTPITAMLRHYDRLLIFKPDGAHTCQYSTLTAGDAVIPGFYTVSLNREIGNEAMGQVRLVDNDARTLFGRSVYEWALASTSVRDERNAKRISDRVSATLGRFELSKCLVLDDEWNREYYIFHDGEAVVHNYGNDTWYHYTNLPVRAAVAAEGVVYFGTPDGRVMRFSREYRNDDGAEIDAYWASGSMDFDMDWRRKYSSMIWVSIKPESQAAVYATAESNIKSDYPHKLIASGLANFTHASFAHWSFGTNRKPQLIRVKLKVKKATYYKFILYSKSASSTATVLAVDFQVRYTGNVK